MLCPFCGKEIHDHSAVCQFCGNPLDASVATRLPAKIGDLAIHFSPQESPANKRATSKQGGVTGDGFSVDFQILDDQGLPIAYDGIADLHVKVSRAVKGKSALPKALFKTKASVKIKASEFQLDSRGYPYYHYVFSAPVQLNAKRTNPSVDIGIKLVPEGGRDPLYRQAEVSARPRD